MTPAFGKGLVDSWPWNFANWNAPYRGDETAGRTHQCFCVGPQPGEQLCPCAKRRVLHEPAFKNLTKPRIRVKAISVPS